jgi:hypothetical protein
MDAITLHVKSDEPDLRKSREGIAKQVRDYFMSNYRVSSGARTIYYLDDQDVNWLKELWGGQSNRGVHWPIRGQGLHGWPRDMWDTFAHVDLTSGEVTWPYDSVIYLHGSTCSVDVQLAMTLAHELQHFVQFANQRHIWAINSLFAKLPNLPTSDLKHGYDLPVEREARIISKRVAEGMFGKPIVIQHISAMINLNSSPEDVADWKFGIATKV